MSCPSSMIVPAVGRRRPAIASTSSVCPFPRRRRCPTISPARTSSDDAAHGLELAVVPHGRSSTSSTRRRARPPLSTRSSTARPTIISARPPRWRPRGRRSPTTLPRRSTVMRSAISSTSSQLVGDEDDRRPRAASARRTPKSSSASCGVSTAVGSSRIRMSGVAVERLQDLDPLLLPTAMSSTRASGSTARP